MEQSLLQRVKLWFVAMGNRVRAFFVQERSRESFTFLGFVLLAFVFWFLQGLNDEVEGSFEVPIELKNVPQEAMLIEDLPTLVEVRIQDRGPAMLNYLINGIEPIQIDFQEYAENSNSFFLASARFKALLHKNMRSSTRILSMSFDTLRVSYTYNPGKRVKLIVKNSVTTSPQCMLSGKITSTVDSVMVYGEAEYLDQINEVYTKELKLKELSDTLRTIVDIAQIPHVRIIPNQVSVEIPVDEIAEKRINVGIQYRNVPEGHLLSTYPSEMEAICMGPIGRLSTIDDDVELWVDYNEIDWSVRTVEVHMSCPDYLHSVRYNNRVTYFEDSVILVKDTLPDLQ